MMDAVDDRTEPGGRARLLFDALTQAADEGGMGIPVSHATPEGAKIEYVNQGMADLLGDSLERVAARSVWPYVAPEELPRLTEMHAHRMRGGDVPRRLE